MSLFARGKAGFTSFGANVWISEDEAISLDRVHEIQETSHSLCEELNGTELEEPC